MALEVELKAHVADPLQLKGRLEALEGISSPFCELKEDTYFCRRGEDALFRMRVEQSGPSFDAMQGTLAFTYKDKAIKGGIEVNEEVEFTSHPDQGSSALEFFLSLGYELYLTKTKKGYLYTYPVALDLPLLTIELVEVMGLGWFLEIELVLDERDKVDRAQKALVGFLSLLGIKESAIEEAYYMHMLKKKKPEA